MDGDVMLKKQNFFRKHFFVFLTGLISTCMLVSIYSLTSTRVYSSETDDKITGSNWMSSLSDNEKLCELNIPGTHDSGTKHTTALASGVVASCQSDSIDKQLTKGLRYFDIRINADLVVNHGGVNCYKNVITIDKNKLTLNHVLSTIEKFLEKNPTETVIVQIKEEGSSKKDFRTEVNSALSKYKKFYKYTNTSAKKLSLKDVRGHFVIFDRSNTVKGGYKIRSWPDNCAYGKVLLDGETAYLQDHYKAVKASTKFSTIKSFYNKLWESSYSSNRFILDFTSCTGPFCPRLVAGTVNSKFEKLLKDNKEKKFGIVLMDFPDSDLISEIYKTNIKK